MLFIAKIAFRLIIYVHSKPIMLPTSILELIPYALPQILYGQENLTFFSPKTHIYFSVLPVWVFLVTIFLVTIAHGITSNNAIDDSPSYHVVIIPTEDLLFGLLR